MQWLLLAIVGWCGTGWPWYFRFGKGGGGIDPVDPWPINCPPCGGVIGAISAIVIYPLVSNLVAEAGFTGLVVTAFAAGSFGNGLIGGIVGMIRGGHSH